MDNKILKQLMSKKNVVSVGRGHKRVGGKDTGKPCIVIGVTKKIPLADLLPEDILPQSIGNEPEEIDVVEVGEIKLL